MRSAVIKKPQKHGMSNTRIYRSVWCAMKQRCHSKSAKDYARYGDKGITVCRRWRDSFINFFNDMGHPPAGMSIERRDNSRGYSPSNCQWATPTEQTRNRSCAVRVAYQGRELPLIEVSKITGIKYITLHARLFRYKWPLEKAISTKPHKGTVYVSH